MQTQHKQFSTLLKFIKSWRLHQNLIFIFNVPFLLYIKNLLSELNKLCKFMIIPPGTFTKFVFLALLSFFAARNVLGVERKKNGKTYHQIVLHTLICMELLC